MGIIYKATNRETNKVYIGKTIRELHERKKSHKCSALTQDSQTYFHRAIRMYGWESFSWEIIDRSDDEKELFQKEIYWVDFYKAFGEGYNLTTGGEGGSGNGYLQAGEKNHNNKYPDSLIRLAKLLKRDTTLSKPEIADMLGINPKYLGAIYREKKRTYLTLTEEDVLPEEYKCYQGDIIHSFSDLVSKGKHIANMNNDEYVMKTLAIRELNLPQEELAELFSMAVSTISRIQNGKRRAEIKIEELTDTQLERYSAYISELKKEVMLPYGT